MRLSLAISPCPNDTFIFEAMVNQLINTSPYEFDVFFGDVEELNERAFNKEFDITKLSYHAFTNCRDEYDLLNAGSALGRNCGPLLISKQPISKEDLNKKVIAIPGEWTTANFLMRFYAPKAENKKEILFSKIEEAINKGEVDAGVIIHENRFTYQERGFHLIQDLGMHWENETTQPIPLGGIVIKNKLGLRIKKDINRLIQQSIQYAWSKENLISEFIKNNASEMDEKVIEEHIKLYVNDFSHDLGHTGKQAIEFLFQRLNKKIPNFVI